MEQKRYKHNGDTKLHIIAVGTRMFLEKGYSTTSSSELSRELGISKGNLTFHFRTKEHLLLELVKILTDFQWNYINNLEENNVSEIERYCSEIAIQIAICEENDIARDFYLSAYASPMTFEHIKKWTHRKNYQIFHNRLANWSISDFWEVENITSAIEGGIIREPCTDSFTLERKISVTLDNLLKIYNIDEQERKKVIEVTLKKDYHKEAKRVLAEFIEYVNRINEEAMEEVLDKG